MSAFTPDRSDESRCVSVHWSLPVQCVLPRAHRANWHEAWHPKSGNRMRYRHTIGATEQLSNGAWTSLELPPPGGFCNEQNPSNPKAFCDDRAGHSWMHRVVYDGCTYTWDSSPSRPLSAEQLTEDVRLLRARVAELEAERHTTNEALSEAAEAIRTKDQRVAELESIAANAGKLYHEWLSTSAEHFSISTLKEVRETPLLAGMQEGRANQYSDCANELRDVLDGEDPDDWEHGVSVEVAKAGEPS